MTDSAPSVHSGLTVFAQRPDARIELATWQRHATEFFNARLGLMVEKKYLEGFPEVDSVEVVVAPRTAKEGVRLCRARPRTDDDLRAAEDADARAGNTGLGLLARRCPTVWIVARDQEEDRLSLLLAAILASVVLGPILSHAGDLFGVRTARLKLERLPP